MQYLQSKLFSLVVVDVTQVLGRQVGRQVGRREGGQVGKNCVTNLGEKRGCGSIKQVGEKGGSWFLVGRQGQESRQYVAGQVISKLKKKNKQQKINQRKGQHQKGQHTFIHQMRNLTPSSGQNSQRVIAGGCWFMLAVNLAHVYMPFHLHRLHCPVTNHLPMIEHLFISLSYLLHFE